MIHKGQQCQVAWISVRRGWKNIQKGEHFINSITWTVKWEALRLMRLRHLSLKRHQTMLEHHKAQFGSGG